MAAPKDASDGHADDVKYAMNLTALSLHELARALGNPVLCMFVVPFVALLKLLRIPMIGGGPFPGRLEIVPASQAGVQQAPRAMQVVAEFRDIGFTPVGDWLVANLPVQTVVSPALMEEERIAATVYSFASYGLSRRVTYEIGTRFANGDALDTCAFTSQTAVDAPPQFHRQLVKGARPAALLEAHRAAVVELAPACGGVAPVATAERYWDYFREDWRVKLEALEKRGVWLSNRGRRRL